MTNAVSRTVVPKAMTGIAGLDEITKGGLPQNRTTLIIGAPGAGKTILSLEFLYRGAAQYGEPGVYVNFGDPREKVLADAKTFLWDMDHLIKENRLIISNLKGTRNASWHDSGYKVEALLEAIAYTVRHTGAKRVALDDTDLTLPGAIPATINGTDLKKLMRGIESIGVTLVMSSVAATDPKLTCSLEEYLADCVIALEQKVVNQVATRRLRIKKYRGTEHGVHEYPYQITSHGLKINPVSTLSLSSAMSDERVSSGISGLDYMLGGGYYRESAVLIAGGTGTGKSNLAMSCLNEGCKRSERVLYVSYEESPAQLKRNFLSVGMNIEEWEKKEQLRVVGILPESHGGEEHHSYLMEQLEEFHPTLLVLDSLSALNRVSSDQFTIDPSMSMLAESKNRGITVLATVNTAQCEEKGSPWEVGLNCFADTILQLQHVKNQEEMRRGIMVLKSRGMKHSAQLRELLITDEGLKVGNTFFDQDDFVLGVARQMEELKEKINPEDSKKVSQDEVKGEQEIAQHSATETPKEKVTIEADGKDEETSTVYKNQSASHKAEMSSEPAVSPAEAEIDETISEGEHSAEKKSEDGDWLAETAETKNNGFDKADENDAKESSPNGAS